MDMENQYLIDHLPNLSTYKTVAGAAKALHRHLTKVATDWGMHGLDMPVLYAPGERSESFGNWWVVWESGPYEWGAYLTGWREDTFNPDWYCECHWGFDLIFVKD